MPSFSSPVLLKIDFVAEIAHPLCVVNLITLERAIQALRNEIVVELQFQPHELAAGLGEAGETAAEGIQRRLFWTREQAEQYERAVEARARALGITFTANVDRRVWNTFDAHRLMRWAGRQQAARALFLALADAACNRGENISSRDVLARIAGEVGLDAAAAYQLLASDEFTTEVRVIEVHYQKLKVREVPTLVVNGRHLINGAVPYETMVGGLRQIAALPT
jgi:predicted DsbA family dithiol-disulfide isomerase